MVAGWKSALAGILDWRRSNSFVCPGQGMARTSLPVLRSVLLDGGGSGPQERLNTFTWGPAGCAMGVPESLRIRSWAKPETPDYRGRTQTPAFWRYHPNKQIFEVFAEEPATWASTSTNMARLSS